MVNISWVVCEDVVCDENNRVKEGWVDCIDKHYTKFFIGSDNVAQFFPIRDTSINLLASNITKYYQLFDKMTPEKAEMVANGNAERLYFAKWDVPLGSSRSAPASPRSSRSWTQTHGLPRSREALVLPTSLSYGVTVHGTMPDSPELRLRRRLARAESIAAMRGHLGASVLDDALSLSAGRRRAPSR